MVFGDLLEKAFINCCVRRPCGNQDYDLYDLNIDFKSHNQQVGIYLAGELHWGEFNYMITYDRFLYSKGGDSFIVLCPQEEPDYSRDDWNNKINILLGYFPDGPFNALLRRDGISDPEDVENKMQKILEKTNTVFEITLSDLDNKIFISRLNKFLKTKIHNDDQLEIVVKKIIPL